MATDLVRVTRLDGPWRTSVPGIEGYTVTGQTIEAAPRMMQFQTINYWKASACSQAMERNKLIWIGWKDSRFRTKDIVTVEEDNSQWQHDGQAAS